MSSSVGLLPCISSGFINCEGGDIRSFEFTLDRKVHDRMFFTAFIRGIRGRVGSVSIVGTSGLFLRHDNCTDSGFGGGFRRWLAFLCTRLSWGVSCWV